MYFLGSCFGTSTAITEPSPASNLVFFELPQTFSPESKTKIGGSHTLETHLKIFED